MKGEEKMKKFEAVLFDADETIFNNQGIHLEVTNKILKSLQLPTSLTNDVHAKWDSYYFKEQIREMEENGFCIDRENAARSLILALKDIGKELSLEEADEFYEFMINEYSEKSKPYPDALELIELLSEKNIRMGIVSNGDHETIINRLQKAKIENQFEFIIAPCHEMPLTKPDSKIFNEALSRIDSMASETIFIGDSPSADIAGANRMGMFSILIDRFENFKNLENAQKPDMKINSFKEMFFLFQ